MYYCSICLCFSVFISAFIKLFFPDFNHIQKAYIEVAEEKAKLTKELAVFDSAYEELLEDCDKAKRELKEAKRKYEKVTGAKLTGE